MEKYIVITKTVFATKNNKNKKMIFLKNKNNENEKYEKCL